MAEQKVETKKTKIKLLADAMIDGELRGPGYVAEVSDEVAKELCDRTFDGYHPFYGTKPEIGPLMASDPLARQKLVRAVRIQ
jgi:hypothetical protein